ncbi:hypothetical protein C8F04DRAFT_1179422 [Mycena alexandri]|uniref:Uncharacterized protein n=1 Tax=Mycena alexandri TaxID=1745969 RepID=A0AAD6T3Q7_9AGAR|nr:hypothetical protein C8F04DRAFT_1179422 [Mycena alexandri]
MAVQAHMVGRTVPAQDGGAGTRFSGLVLAREAAQTSRSSDFRLRSSLINLAQLFCGCAPQAPAHFLRTSVARRFGHMFPYPPCTSGSSSPAFLVGGTDRGTYAKKLNSHSFRASPPCTASSSRPFVAGAVDRGICVKKLNLYSANVFLTYRASPPYTASSPFRAFPDREVPHVKNMCSLRSCAYHPCSAGHSSRAFVFGAADCRMTMNLPSMRSSASRTYPPCTAVSPSRAFVFGAADRRMTVTSFRCYVVYQPNLLADGGSSVPAYDGGADTGGDQMVSAQDGGAGWGGERCLRKMAAQARMVGRTVPAQDGGAGTRFSGLVLAREAAQNAYNVFPYPPCTSGSSSPAFLVGGTDRGTYAKKLNSHSFRASPPCTASSSRPFVAGAVDRGIGVKKLNLYSANVFLTYRASPPYTASSPFRAFPDREVPHVKNMCSLRSCAYHPCSAGHSSRAFVFGAADCRMTMNLPSMRSSASRTYPPCTAASPSQAFVSSAADSRMTMDLPSVSYLMQLGFSRCIPRISPLHHHGHGHRR